MAAGRGVYKGLDSASCMESVGFEIDRAEACARLLHIMKHEGLDMSPHLIDWLEEVARDGIAAALAEARDYLKAAKQRAARAK